MNSSDRDFLYYRRILFDTLPSDLVLMRRTVLEDSSLSVLDVASLINFIDFLICYYN